MMKREIVIAFCVAVLFGFGLNISGMTNPQNVIGFLDIFGAWRPALALVMGAGILVGLPLFLISARLQRPLFGLKFPKITTKIDGRLLIGAAIFGVGWGIVGICPGPAIVAISFAPMEICVFLIAMFLGAKIVDIFGNTYFVKTPIIGPILSPESARPSSAE